MANEVELSIIIVNWNGEKYISDCLESIFSTIRNTNFEVIVVDNDSSDSSCSIIKKRFKDVILIENNKNHMFAKANNIGFNYSRGNIIAIVNPDIVFKPTVIDTIVNSIRTSKDEAVTTILLNHDNTVQQNMHRGFPTFFRLLLSYFYVYKGWFSNWHIVRQYLLLDLDVTKDSYIEQAAGALIFLSRKSIEAIGTLFDEERFPLFFNDVDLCYRLNKNNIKIKFIVTEGVYHLKGASISKIKIDNKLMWNLFGAKNYFKKHEMIFDYIIFRTLYSLFSFVYKLKNKFGYKNW